ncbi:hypothetical protein Prede_1446 [Prevotella dentalis DSM 3688]|uniref:Uncharacterized protein n=1 Tax=Prevotella dentalis (strain ATCC 49559 / DSM 3688 / JCM 13448 / NCTC 12043 / ES 2772) TaxID=908937 RepID=L0JB49_PREDD|nr:hypothetical protein Prede_1446 [Prevotella dentalis DSM 3688]
MKLQAPLFCDRWQFKIEHSAFKIGEQSRYFVALSLGREAGETTYTLNLKCMMSPSCTTYSLPSMPSLPASRTALSEPYCR